jgi:hypothetical protein
MPWRLLQDLGNLLTPSTFFRGATHDRLYGRDVILAKFGLFPTEENIFASIKW